MLSCVQVCVGVGYRVYVFVGDHACVCSHVYVRVFVILCMCLLCLGECVHELGECVRLSVEVSLSKSPLSVSVPLVFRVLMCAFIGQNENVSHVCY